MLKIHPNCEYCDKDIAPDSHDATICTFECTFCKSCAESKFNWVCPKCNGNLTERPVRPTNALEACPTSTKRLCLFVQD
ncbi:DUF1272 domain-containing protein [Porticoccaceae bacterium]|nr:DUF1272 domain-containing protein [Porticoccaceae bacterium]MDB4581375.1 DUF1272 domain-containing protein [Porticoccaceae bacterium]MDC3261184.1 DUF1272 domain-containing protein [bacterium]